jgi:hypothetical protein
MGILDKVNPEQLMCEVNGPYNGKFSNVQSEAFMRHFHWGPLPYSKHSGDSMLRRAMKIQPSILLRGNTAASVTPQKWMSSLRERAGANDKKCHIFFPKPPDTARMESNRNRRALTTSKSTHKTLADHRKERVDTMCQVSTRLEVMSAKYGNANFQAVRRSRPNINNVIQGCKHTGFAVAKAMDETSINQQINVLQVSTPLTGISADGLPGTGTPGGEYDEALQNGYRLRDLCTVSPPETPWLAERRKLERWKDQMRLATLRGRISRIPFA